MLRPTPYVLRSKSGFTLIELLLTVGIVMIVGIVGVTNFSGFRRNQELDLAAKALVDYLRYVQQKSITQDESRSWGVHLAATAGASPDSYTIFSGADYATGSSTATVTFSSEIQFSNPAPGQNRDVIFSKVTGAPQGGATTIVLELAVTPAVFRTINISSVGLIELVSS